MITVCRLAGPSPSRQLRWRETIAQPWSVARCSIFRSRPLICLPPTANSCSPSNGPNFACTRMSPTALATNSPRRFRGCRLGQRIHAILRKYSSEVIAFLSKFLSPYAGKWIIDFASFRPLEEDGRDAPASQAQRSASRGRFSQPPDARRPHSPCFHQSESRPNRACGRLPGHSDLWRKQFAADAGLHAIAAKDSVVSQNGSGLGREAGRARNGPHALRCFHAALPRLPEREFSRFRRVAPKCAWNFRPCATWIVYTDGVAHAVMSGQYAMEQTFLIPADALVSPQDSAIQASSKISQGDR